MRTSWVFTETVTYVTMCVCDCERSCVSPELSDISLNTRTLHTCLSVCVCLYACVCMRVTGKLREKFRWIANYAQSTYMSDAVTASVRVCAPELSDMSLTTHTLHTCLSVCVCVCVCVTGKLREKF